MRKMKEVYETMSFIHKIRDLRGVLFSLPEEAVLLHIHARGILSLPNRTTCAIAVLHFVFFVFFSLVFLPFSCGIAPFIAAAVSGLFFYLFFSTDFEHIAILFSIVLIAARFSRFVEWSFQLAFSLCDMVACGFLTKLWALNVIARLSVPSNRSGEITNFDNFQYTSKLLPSMHPQQIEIDRLMDIINSSVERSNRDQLTEYVDAYWRQTNEAPRDIEKLIR